MATVGYAKIRVPGGRDAPVGPGALTEFALDIDPHLLHHVVDQAMRDAQFSDAPVHTAVTADDGTLWLKTSETENVWATVYEPLPEWRPVALASGFESSSIDCEVRREGAYVSMRGRVIKSDGTNFQSPDLKIGSVPEDCIPRKALASFATSCSIGGDTTEAAGRMEVLDADTASANGVPGDILFWYQGTGGTPYVDLSGSWWID